MTTTITSLGTRRGQGTIHFMRRAALAVGSLAAGIGARWNAFVESGQLGPDPARSISRHAGGRT